MKVVRFFLILALIFVIPLLSFAKTTISENDLSSAMGQQGVTINKAVISESDLSQTTAQKGVTIDKALFSDSNLSKATVHKGVKIKKKALSDSDLENVLGQDGVTINFNCFTLGAITINVMSFGDNDGCTTCAGYGSVGWMGSTITASSNFLQLSGNMTIDVGTSGTRTAVSIGLPTINMAGSITQVIKLASTSDLTGAALHTLGTQYMSGISFIPSGTLTIFAH